MEETFVSLCSSKDKLNQKEKEKLPSPATLSTSLGLTFLSSNVTRLVLDAGQLRRGHTAAIKLTVCQAQRLAHSKLPVTQPTHSCRDSHSVNITHVLPDVGLVSYT